MDRKEFIKKCGFACLAVSGVGALIQGCVSARIVPGTMSGAFISIPESDFEVAKSEQKKFRKYVVVQNDKLKFPICVFRLEENKYSAVWMQCSHQGAELQVFGDKLECPAHGASFNNKGETLGAPADTNLRTFPVTIENNQIMIKLS